MSFLKNFMHWTSGSEVPENYFFWSGLSCLAALVNGRVSIKMGKYVIHPNLYIVLLGPPANGKTSAMRRAEKVIRKFEDIPVSAQSETAEGLVRFMREKCIQSLELDGQVVPYTPITCYLSELSNFFGKDPAGMVDVLTGIWDCAGESFHRRTKGQGEDMLPRPSVNLVGCTTQDWITTYMKADIVGGGFTRRVIFVNELMTDDSHRVAFPEETPDQLVAFDNCVAYGQVLRDVTGEMQWGEGTRAWFQQWYNTRPISREADVRGFHKSKPGIMLKVATLIALSREPKLEITVPDLEVALALLDKTEVNLHKVFQSIGRNELNVIAQKVMGWVESFPEMDYKKPDGTVGKTRFIELKKLKSLMYREAPGRECEEILNHLIATDKLFAYQTVLPGTTVTKAYLGLKV